MILPYLKSSIILPMDGTNNGTVFTNWGKGGSISRLNSPVTSTTQSKYYGSSCYFPPDDGTAQASMLRLPALAFGTNPFTISVWAWTSDVSSYTVFLDLRATDTNFTAVTNSDSHFLFYIRAQDQKLALAYGPTSILTLGTTIVPVNVWNHYALTRDSSGVIRGFLNGIEEFNLTVSNDFSSNYPVVGAIPVNSVIHPSRYFNDFLIVFDEALWTKNFTPPSRIVGEVSGTVLDELGSPVSRNVLVMLREDSSVIYQALSDVSTGSFTIRAPSTECNRIVLHEGFPEKSDLFGTVIPI